ncbi:bifunctional sterol desaturase/short chain dehydrogenase [Kamptonema sp. UHCC 0994]|uniref:bifunctional sterol desaturase/short chain dehydrogenase n=1 Tax=Kamptonema sp. UHCC 0994 TaxID=3031329 RepID=UPI0023BA1E38|nr:bifunctional sterol desaturase/short chain dehydrogenase [Kamptonema sp. UHCC 0994]MDF0552570.1 bifunctional sterol desaturase/short chain dehydrogenase [Kamptonema sp. UHCC 0994]
MTNYWIAAAWGLGSVLLAEVVRDIYHVLAHIYPPLYRLHVWHHRVFRPNLTPVNDRIYQQAQWRNDVPEALVMLLCGLLLWVVAYITTPNFHPWALVGCTYTLGFLVSAIARGYGFKGADELTDLTHQPGDFLTPPSSWLVNRPYHWRHHFDNQNAYYCGTITLIDKLMGTALSLKGKTIAVTGASGTLGRQLLTHLHKAGAKVIALTSGTQTLSLNIDGENFPISTINWHISQESELAELLEKIDILVINHGINVQGDRTKDAIANSYEINTFSAFRLIELFLTTVRTNEEIARKEIWVNTSEAEVIPAVSPLYELSKRALGDLVTLRRLDAPCVIRKLILGPFKSNLNPIGIMSADWVAKQIIKQAQSDTRNIIVTINPLTFIAFPIKEFFVSIYFQIFSRQSLSVKEVEIEPSSVEAKTK